MANTPNLGPKEGKDVELEAFDVSKGAGIPIKIEAVSPSSSVIGVKTNKTTEIIKGVGCNRLCVHVVHL